MEYQCPDCPYVYNEEASDPDKGISPGTKFEDLPAIWVCPICGAEKTGFEQQESSMRITQSPKLRVESIKPNQTKPLKEVKEAKSN